MPRRPFFVLPDGECVPLEGDWHVIQLRGDWYVLGHNSVVPCGSERAARGMLAELERRSDTDQLVADALAGLDRIPGDWESDSLGESEIA